MYLIKQNQGHSLLIMITSFLPEQTQDHSKFGYASSNRDKNKWSCRNHEGASKLRYWTLVQPNNHDWSKVPAFTTTWSDKQNRIIFYSGVYSWRRKATFSNIPAQYLTAVRIPTLFVLDASHIDTRQTDNDNTPTDTWQLAIDPSTLMVQDSTQAFLTENEGKLPFQVWETESQPITMTAKVCEVEWELNKNTAAPPPQSPVACVENGTVDQVRLVPFAAAKLRLGEIPVMEIWNEVLLRWLYEGRKGEIEIILSSCLYIFDTLDIELVGRRQRIACLWHFKWTRLKNFEATLLEWIFDQWQNKLAQETK